MSPALDAWIRREWPHGRPPWHISVFEEMFEAEQLRIAQARAERAESQKIAALERRIARLETGLKRMANEVVEAVGEVIGKERVRTRKMISDAIEARGLMSDQGVWAVERTYTPGSVVSHKGSSWVCRVESRGMKPGDANAAWRMLHKSGGGS